MTNLRIGVFVVPDATDPARTVEQVLAADAADAAELDLGGGWADQHARLAAGLRFDTLVLSVPDEDPIGFVRRLGEETAPAARGLL